MVKVYINVWARAIFLLDHAFIQVEKHVYKQVGGLSQGSAAAPFLADFSLFMLDLKFRERVPRTVWHGRYLDDILLVVPDQEDNEAVITVLKETFAEGRQKLDIMHAGRDRYAAWLGFEINPEGLYRVHFKTTWVNLFSPFYDSISPRLHIGHLLIMAVRFITFNSNNELFLACWARFTEQLPARGYPEVIQNLILDKIEVATAFDPRTVAGHMFLKQTYGYWLRQTKQWRLLHKEQSPYKTLWQGTLNSSEILIIERLLRTDFAPIVIMNI